MATVTRVPARALHIAWALVCLVLLLSNLVHIAGVFRGDWRWTVNDDVRQNLFFLERARDPALFQNDLIADHAQAFQPLGFAAGAWVLSWAVGALAASKLVAVALTASTLVLVVWAASAVFGPRSPLFGAALALVTAHGPLWYLAASGLARGCAAPLSVLALIAWHRRGPGLFLLTVALAALFSPTVFIFLGGLAAWRLAFPDGADTRPRRLLARAAPYVLVFVPSGAIMWAWHALATRRLGPAADYARARIEPAFNDGGRWPHEAILGPAEELLGLAQRTVPLPAGLPAALSLLVLLALVAAGIAIACAQRFRGEDDVSGRPARAVEAGAAFVVTAAVCWTLARTVALRLYFPNRYLVPAECAIAFAVVGGLGGAAGLLAAPRGRPRWRWAVVAVVALIGAVMLWESARRWPVTLAPTYNVSVPRAERELHAFLATLAKDAVVAGNPFLMDNVPIFARRSVLLNYETSLPLYPTYARAIDHRTRALVDAYFGWSDEALLVLVRTMRVSHLVVSRSDFAGGTPWAIEPWSRVPVGSGEPYMAPYRAEIKRRLAAKPPAVPWAWERAAAQATVWENEAFIVLDLGRE